VQFYQLQIVLSNLRQLILVTGPARSGKSEWAEHLAKQSDKLVVYVATAQEISDDVEWQTRIEQHQQRRPATWKTQLVPIELAQTIQAASPTECLLIDSLGTWLANLLEQDEALWEQTLTDLLASLINATSDVIIVSEETGWGVVPAYPIGRTFRDRLGRLTREIGAIATSTYLIAGGHVLNLSHLGSPLPKFHLVGDETDPAKP
jgi:adenosylcobinamide kinase / adenosylcobinamide-phosphate guanylyltransferase